MEWLFLIHGGVEAVYDACLVKRSKENQGRLRLPSAQGCLSCMKGGRGGGGETSKIQDTFLKEKNSYSSFPCLPQEMVIGGLKPDTTYSITVAAYTTKGDGARSKPKLMVTKSAGQCTDKSGFCSLFLCFFLFWLCSCSRIGCLLFLTGTLLRRSSAFLNPQTYTVLKTLSSDRNVGYDGFARRASF